MIYIILVWYINNNVLTDKSFWKHIGGESGLNFSLSDQAFPPVQLQTGSTRPRVCGILPFRCMHPTRRWYPILRTIGVPQKVLRRRRAPNQNRVARRLLQIPRGNAQTLYGKYWKVNGNQYLIKKTPRVQQSHQVQPPQGKYAPSNHPSPTPRQIAQGYRPLLRQLLKQANQEAQKALVQQNHEEGDLDSGGKGVRLL